MAYKRIFENTPVKPIRWPAKQFKSGDVILGKDRHSGNYIVYLKSDNRFTEYTPNEMLEVFNYSE